MSSATFTPAPSSSLPQARRGGATAATGARHHHRLGNALRAVKVFAGAAFSVAVLGDCDEAGVTRRR